MELNSINYFSPQAQERYFSVSQFKDFERCEAGALSRIRGDWIPMDTTALLVGSYVDAYFGGELDLFAGEHPEIFKRDGALKADYIRAGLMIDRILEDDTLMMYLSGERQQIRTANLFGYPWKVKMDFYNGERIVDLKTVKDFSPIYDPAYGCRRDWIAYWGYDLQGAIYQRVEQISSGRQDPLPFYIVAVTKEPVPDIALIHIPQHMLDAAIKAHGVEERIDRFAMIKAGEVEPRRCEECDYCKQTKKITGAVEYEPEEA